MWPTQPTIAARVSEAAASAISAATVRFRRLHRQARSNQLGQAEVGDPDGVVLVDQKVRRLDVAVEHPLLVGVGERLGRLRREEGGLTPAIGALGRARSATIRGPRPAPAP